MKQNNDRVLIVEDTMSVAMVFQTWLKKRGLEADIAGTGKEGLAAVRKGGHRVVLLDLQLPDANGLDLLKTISEESPDVAVVVVTASGSINVAVEAMRLGAYDFAVKPAAEERLATTVRNAMERQQLARTVREIAKPYEGAGSHGFIGKSLPMIAVYKTIDAVSRSNAPVFITGESGTGKEVCAQAVHQASPRRSGRFVALNCAAIPKDLIESEIFGHVRGAYTGATGDREGAAIAADGGTLFLDEICEMDLNLQAKLLRFLQTGTVQKVGSDRPVKVDVRIVCATNRDPLKEVTEGRFREDLYYRLFVVPIELPPLRDRQDDVVLIARRLLETMTAEEGKAFRGFEPEAETAMLAYTWPGNVRELQNVIRKAVILNDGEFVAAGMLSIRPDRAGAMLRAAAAPSAVETGGAGTISLDLNQPFHEIERQIIEAAIRLCGESIPKASAMLELSPSTIYRKRESWAA